MYSHIVDLISNVMTAHLENFKVMQKIQTLQYI